MANNKEYWKTKIDQMDTPQDAAAIHNALLELRHDTFGKSICSALRIPYNNDLTYTEIRDILEKQGIENVPTVNIRYTPDNVYVTEDKRIYIIDYKVSSNRDYYEATLQKYNQGFNILRQQLDNEVEIVLLVLNPYQFTVYCNNQNFLETMLGTATPDYRDEIGWIQDLLQEIENQFGANEEFLNLKNYDTFDYTEPWTKESLSRELLDDPVYKEFINQLTTEQQAMFNTFLNFDLEQENQKDLDNLFYKCISEFSSQTKESMDKIINDLETGNLSSKTPKLEMINQAWNKLYSGLQEKKTMSSDFKDATPTVHMLWGKNVKILGNQEISDNFTKMCLFAKFFRLMRIPDPETDNIGPFLKRVGCMLDLALHKEDYENAVKKQKEHITGTKRRPIAVANAHVYHDQQFFIPNCQERKKLYKQAHIGTDKKFKMRANDDPILEKPEMLDPFNQELVGKCEEAINSTKCILNNKSGGTYKKHAISDYAQKIKDSMQPSAFAKLEAVLESDYYKYLVDSSMLMKGALSMSEVSYHDTFRMIYSASTSTVLILLPSANIEAARSSVCFFTAVIHDEQLAYTGCEHETYDLQGDLKLTVSKIIRLDKERCKKIVESPNLFLLLSATLIQNNPTEDISNIMNYAFYMSANVTKSVMSLTEPGRYLVMGASSLSCNVDEYISSKMDPMTKNAFSVVLMKKLKIATELAHTGLRELLAGEIVLESEAIIKKGPKKDPSIKSVWFESDINLESYITEVFLPFYINQKGLHYYHHNIMALSKVPLEIEKENRQKEASNKGYWCDENSKDQHINIPVFMTYLSKYHLKHKNKFNQFRANLETKSNFKKPPYLTRTLTSSKSCIKVGKFDAIKGKKDVIESGKQAKPRVIASKYSAEHRSNLCHVSTDLLDTNGYMKFVLINTMGYILDDKVRIELTKLGIGLPLGTYKAHSVHMIGYNGTQIAFTVIDDNLPRDEKLADLHWIMREHCEIHEPNGVAIHDFDDFEEHPDNRIIIHKKIKNHMEEHNIKIPYIICSRNEIYPEFALSEATDNEVINKNITLLKHAGYTDIKDRVPNYVDFITTKVYDELYKEAKTNNNENLIDMAFRKIREKKQYYVTLFPKEQRTAVDREIYEGEFDLKIVLYVIERIYKEICRVDSDEMISQPGDTKILNIEKNRDSHLYEAIKRGNMANSCLLEINADMSKFSAQDITYKFILCIVMNPILYREEKEHLILFFCHYIRKRLLIPDSVLAKLLDQRGRREDDIFFESTDGLDKNWVEIGQNWLQGNLNYIASFVHSVGMMYYTDTIDRYYQSRSIETIVKPLIHSDDQQTGILLIAKKTILPTTMETEGDSAVYLDEEVEACRLITAMKASLLKFGLLLNDKKTYASKYIKEFVSLHNLNGQPFSVYSRFLFPCVGACAFMGPYEDLSARLSGIRTAAQHGSPPGLLWLAVAISVHCTYDTYSMLPGQKNDPMMIFTDVKSRFKLPIELGGYPNFLIPTFVILGIEAHDLRNIMLIFKSISIPSKEGLLSEETMNSINIKSLTIEQLFYLKAIFKFCMLQDLDMTESAGETFEMRSRSIITPKRFTTARLIKKLDSYVDHKLQTAESVKNNLSYMLNHPELLVTKASNSEDFKNLILFRYYSRTFRESLSLQSPVQLFIEQVLHSSRQCIEKEFVRKFTRDVLEEMEQKKNQLLGKITIAEALKRLNDIVVQMKLDTNNVKQIIRHKVMNDPLLVTLCNAEESLVILSKTPRTSNFSSQMPLIRVIRSVTHTPAEIIKYTTSLIKEGKLTTNNMNVVRASGKETLLDSDAQNLVNYLSPLGHMATLITILGGTREYHMPDNSDIKDDLSEVCRILQISYQFLSQTGNIKKSVLLEKRLYGGIPDFLRTLYGCLLQDSTFFIVDFSKNVVCTGIKGYIIKDKNKAHFIASRCFKAICYFIDKYINPDHRAKIARTIIENFSYNGYTMRDLYDSIKNTPSVSSEFPALLYMMGDLLDSDIIRILKTQRRVKTTWLQEQEVREAMLGEYKVVYDGGDVLLQIHGHDKNIVELTCHHTSRQFQPRDRNVFGCLNRFRSDVDIASIRSTTRQVDGEFVLYRERNTKGGGLQLRIEKFRSSMKSNDILAPVQLRHMESTDLNIETVKVINNEKKSLRYFHVNPQTCVVTRRSDLTVLNSLSGPELSSTNISLNMLMHNSKCIESTFGAVTEKNIKELSKIFCCIDPNTEVLQTETNLDESVFTFEEREIDININLKTIVRSKDKSNLSIRENVATVCNDLISWYKKLLTGDEKLINIEIQYYMCILKLSQRLNQWSRNVELLDKAIHVLLLLDNQHHKYHTFDLPPGLESFTGRLNINNCFQLTTAAFPTRDPFWKKVLTEISFSLRQGITAYSKELECNTQTGSTLFNFMTGLISGSSNTDQSCTSTESTNEAAGASGRTLLRDLSNQANNVFSFNISHSNDIDSDDDDEYSEV